MAFLSLNLTNFVDRSMERVKSPLVHVTKYPYHTHFTYDPSSDQVIRDQFDYYNSVPDNHKTSSFGMGDDVNHKLLLKRNEWYCCVFYGRERFVISKTVQAGALADNPIVVFRQSGTNVYLLDNHWSGSTIFLLYRTINHQVNLQPVPNYNKIKFGMTVIGLFCLIDRNLFLRNGNVGIVSVLHWTYTILKHLTQWYLDRNISLYYQAFHWLDYVLRGLGLGNYYLNRLYEALDIFPHAATVLIDSRVVVYHWMLLASRTRVESVSIDKTHNDIVGYLNISSTEVWKHGVTVADQFRRLMITYV